MDKDSEYWYGMSDPALLEVLGQFIQRTRLNQNRTQQSVAEAAGINRSTLVKIENGKGGTMLSFIQVMRALEQLQLLAAFAMKNEISPLQLAKMEMKKRQRAGKQQNSDEIPESSW